jgi:hypothetical protein
LRIPAILFLFGSRTSSSWAAPVEDPAAPPSDDTTTPLEETLPQDQAPESSDEDYGATARIESPPREATRRTIPKEELTVMAGTRGDALRAIEVLPGVGRTTLQDGTPVLRGASTTESLTFIEGATVPLLFHFGGVTSVFNSRLLQQVDVYPGNFSTRYGGATGGIIAAKVRDPRSDAVHGVLDLNLIDTSILAETPMGNDASVAIAARRSNIDLIFDRLVPKGFYSVVAAPVYYDYQGVAAIRLGERHKVQILGYGSHDAFHLLFADPSKNDPGLRGNIEAAIDFQYLQARVESRLFSALRQSVQLNLGRSTIDQQFGDWAQHIRTKELRGRAEWTAEVVPELRILFGVEGGAYGYRGTYFGPPGSQTEGDPRANDPAATSRLIGLSADGTRTVSAAYAELDVRPIPPLLLVPGVRADYDGQLRAFSVDPRLVARYEVGGGTTLKAAVGRFSQSAPFWQALDGVGNPKLRPYHALQTSAGFEQTLGDSIQIGAEGFYKYISQRVVGTAGGAPPHFINDGVGRIYGGELSLRARIGGDTFAYLAYTLSRSERRDRALPWRLFDQDQTHVLSVLVSQKLGRGWTMGARFRFVRGNPRTDVIGAVYDARGDAYFPLYGPINAARNPPFHQLDFRVEKTWQLSALALSVYLEGQNVYNRSNPEGIRYSYDYSQSEVVSGLPIVPNLGVRGEL